MAASVTEGWQPTWEKELAVQPDMLHHESNFQLTTRKYDYINDYIVLYYYSTLHA